MGLAYTINTQIAERQKGNKTMSKLPKFSGDMNNKAHGPHADGVADDVT